MGDEPKHPEIEVELSGHDGNAMMIISRVRKALLRADAGTEEIEKFTTEAMSGDYAHVLSTCAEWVTVS